MKDRSKSSSPFHESNRCACSIWQHPGEGSLRLIFEYLVKLPEGTALVRQSSLVCRAWRKAAIETLLEDTAASRPDMRLYGQSRPCRTMAEERATSGAEAVERGEEERRRGEDNSTTAKACVIGEVSVSGGLESVVQQLNRGESLNFSVDEAAECGNASVEGPRCRGCEARGSTVSDPPTRLCSGTS